MGMLGEAAMVPGALTWQQIHTHNYYTGVREIGKLGGGEDLYCFPRYSSGYRIEQRE